VGRDKGVGWGSRGIARVGQDGVACHLELVRDKPRSGPGRHAA